jgi:hypothetical protein
LALLFWQQILSFGVCLSKYLNSPELFLKKIELPNNICYKEKGPSHLPNRYLYFSNLAIDQGSKE